MAGFWFISIRFLTLCLVAGALVSCKVNVPITDPEHPGTTTIVLPTLQPSTAPFVYQVPAAPSNWPDFNGTVINGREVGTTSVQQSGTIQIEVRKSYGGSLQIYDKVTNQQLINFKDLGRESGLSSYSGPASFADDSPHWKGIGYNPLLAGDAGFNPSPVLMHGFVNGWIYTKTQCMSWPHEDGRLLPFFYEQWVRVDGNKVQVKVRLTNQRPDKTFYGPLAQEWPFAMINGTRKIHFYNGPNPYTNDVTTVTDGAEDRTASNQYVTQRGYPFGLTEPWQAVEIGPNRLIGVYAPDYFVANHNIDNIAARESWEGGNTLTYLTNTPLAHLDSDNTWYKEYTFIIGTEQEIRDYVYAQERFPKPDFFFNKFNGRNGWVIFDGGYDQKEPFTTNNWQVTYTGQVTNGVANAYNTKLVSPYSSWKASDFNTIYIRMAYSGTPGSGAQVPLQLVWLRNGQAPDGLDSTLPNQNKIRFPNGVRNRAAQSVRFMAVNDGQFHTYQISFANLPGWTGVIQQFEITHDPTLTYVAPGEVLTLNYLGVREPSD